MGDPEIAFGLDIMRAHQFTKQDHWFIKIF